MAQSALIAALLAGLLGGLHCVAMCGGYVAATAATSPLLPARALAWRQAVAHAGRLLAYAIGGAVFGGMGGIALGTTWTPLQRGLYVAANLLLLVLAYALARQRSPFAAFEKAGLAVYRAVLPHAAPLTRSGSLPARFGLGILWGMTPCALVYGVLPVAMLAGSALDGALVMLMFGLGTLPNLALATVALDRGRRWFSGAATRRAAALLVAAFGVAGLYRALFVPEALAHGPFCFLP